MLDKWEKHVDERPSKDKEIVNGLLNDLLRPLVAGKEDRVRLFTLDGANFGTSTGWVRDLGIPAKNIFVPAPFKSSHVETQSLKENSDLLEINVRKQFAYDMLVEAPLWTSAATPLVGAHLDYCCTLDGNESTRPRLDADALFGSRALCSDEFPEAIVSVTFCGRSNLSVERKDERFGQIQSQVARIALKHGYLTIPEKTYPYVGAMYFCAFTVRRIPKALEKVSLIHYDLAFAILIFCGQTPASTPFVIPVNPDKVDVVEEKKTSAGYDENDDDDVTAWVVSSGDQSENEDGENELVSRKRYREIVEMEPIFKKCKRLRSLSPSRAFPIPRPKAECKESDAAKEPGPSSLVSPLKAPTPPSPQARPSPLSPASLKPHPSSNPAASPSALPSPSKKPTSPPSPSAPAPRPRPAPSKKPASSILPTPTPSPSPSPSAPAPPKMPASSSPPAPVPSPPPTLNEPEPRFGDGEQVCGPKSSGHWDHALVKEIEERSGGYFYWLHFADEIHREWVAEENVYPDGKLDSQCRKAIKKRGETKIGFCTRSVNPKYKDKEYCIFHPVIGIRKKVFDKMRRILDKDFGIVKIGPQKTLQSLVTNYDLNEDDVDKFVKTLSRSFALADVSFKLNQSLGHIVAVIGEKIEKKGWRSR